MEMTDDYGNNIFETIKITLVSAPHTHDGSVRAYTVPCSPQVCDDCLKTDHPENVDKLASMPRWLSSKKVETQSSAPRRGPRNAPTSPWAFRPTARKRPWHRGHRGHDQARAQQAAVRRARARRQHQPRLRGVRSLGGGASAFSMPRSCRRPTAFCRYATHTHATTVASPPCAMLVSVLHMTTRAWVAAHAAQK